MPPNRRSMISLRQNNRPAARAPNPQVQSLLFTRLPADLRYEIFQLTLNYSTIALGPRDRADGRSGLEIYPWADGNPTREEVLDARLLSLALTCRLAAREALSFLYGTNTFGVGNLGTVSLLTVRPTVRPLIRRLDISLSLSKPPKLADASTAGWRRALKLDGRSRLDRQWESMWQDMAKFEHLQWLRIQLVVPWAWSSGWRNRERELLAPLVQLSREGTWRELMITWTRHQDLKVAAEDMLVGWSVRRNAWVTDIDPPALSSSYS